MNLREQQKATTRARLIETATAQFAAAGYADASLIEIAKAAGLTTGALYHHFESKQALFEAAAEALEAEAQIEVAKRVKARVPSAAMLRDIAAATMDVLSDPAMNQVLLIDAPNVFGLDRWRAVEAKYGLGALTQLMTYLKETGALKAESPAVSARLLLSVMIEAARIANSAPDRRAARKSASGFVRRCVDSLFQD